VRCVRNHGMQPEKLLRQLSRQTLDFFLRWNVLERNRLWNPHGYWGKMEDAVIRNDEAVGSSPTSSTKFFQHLRSWVVSLFGDDPIGPFHQRDKDSRGSELRSPLVQVCFRDPTGPGTGSSRKDGNVFRDNFVESFA